MKKKGFLIAMLSLVFLLILAPVSSAFSDIKGNKSEKHIHSLKDRGVISENKGGKFKPKDGLTYAEAVVLLDKAFKLDLSHIRFVKIPLASDIYKHVHNDKWYSQSFVDGYYNGIILADDVKPNDKISREHFAHLLMQQVDRKGEYPLIQLYINYNDSDKVNADYSNSIQKLLILQFAELSKGDYFYPKQTITRGEAASWLDNALNFVDEIFGQPDVEEGVKLENVKLTTAALTDKVNQVTISADVPHRGYGIKVTNIRFDGNTAYVKAELVKPQDDLMYAQVITNVSTSVYVEKQFKVKLDEK